MNVRKRKGPSPCVLTILAVAVLTVVSLLCATPRAPVRVSARVRVSASDAAMTMRAANQSLGAAIVACPPVPVCDCPAAHSCKPSLCDDAKGLAAAAKKVFRYESPLTDTDTLAAHAPAFRKLPAEAWPSAGQEMVEFWRTLQPYTKETSFSLNGMYDGCDSAILHAFVRHTKPRRVFEIGSGFSTRIVHNALAKNKAENGVSVRHLCVEPYRASILTGLGVEVIEKPIQEVDLSIFRDLEAGDILFLDNSHVIRPYGDTILEFLWILPRLKRGVFVHIHDIFLPYDYIPRWMVEDLRAYTEQWLLAAFLYGNSDWKVVFHNGHKDDVSGHLLEVMSKEDKDNYLSLCSYDPKQAHIAPPASIFLQRIH